MEELLGHPPFGSNLIGCMEKSLLQALEWKLLSTTTYSYLQLMETLQDDELMKRRATQMLLQTLLGTTTTHTLRTHTYIIYQI